MLTKTFVELSLYQFENLAKFDNINHFVSSRKGGVSQGEIGGLNLSFKVNDETINVIKNRNLLSDSLGINTEKIIFPSQTHTVNVKVVTESTKENDLEETDAVICNTKGICICVMSADCVPILLYDTKNQVVAAIHAGWKGTVGKIVSNTVNTMQELFSTNPQNIIAGIGPSICPDVYEVGEEVISAVEAGFGKGSSLIKKSDKQGKGYFNLWEANKIQLLEMGVLQKSIEIANICTFQNSDIFFSARKSSHKAGRFAAGIMLK